MAELLYEGKAKQVYKTEKEDEYLIHYKDDATAGNGVKHDKFEGKGVLNNTISCIIFDMLAFIASASICFLSLSSPSLISLCLIAII